MLTILFPRSVHLYIKIVFILWVLPICSVAFELLTAHSNTIEIKFTVVVICRSQILAIISKMPKRQQTRNCQMVT